MHAKSLQLCPTLCDSMDCSPLGSSVHGDSPGKNTGVGCHDLLQGVFLEVDPEIEPTSLMSPALTGGFFTTSATSEDEVKCEVLVTQSCLTLCDPMDHSLPDFSVHGILQARILEWVAMHALLQGIFQTQGLNPHLLWFLHCRWSLYQ